MWLAKMTLRNMLMQVYEERCIWHRMWWYFDAIANVYANAMYGAHVCIAWIERMDSWMLFSTEPSVSTSLDLRPSIMSIMWLCKSKFHGYYFATCKYFHISALCIVMCNSTSLSQQLGFSAGLLGIAWCSMTWFDAHMWVCKRIVDVAFSMS